MKKIFRTGKLLFLVTCMFLVLGSTGCGKNEENKLSIAYFDNITHGQALIMKNQNTLQEKLGDETEVEWVSFNAGPAEVEACFAGDIDIGFIGPVPAATANIKSNGDFVIISGATNGGTVLIARKDANIKSVKDLANKNVGVPQLGNTQHLLLLDLMKENNLSPKSDGGNVNVIEAQNADVANLFSSGELDAAIIPEPWGTTILKGYDAEIVVDYDQFQNGAEYSTAVVIVNKEYMQEHKDIVRAFLETHLETTEYIINNPEEAGKIMNAQLDKDTGKQLDEDVIADAISKIKYTCDIPKDSIMNYAKTSVEQKFIAKEPDDSAFDSSLLDEISK